MDGRAGEGSTTGDRPLTRRELRARAAQEAARAQDGAQGGARDAARDGADGGAAGSREADPWEAAVGWALRGELPPALPPEPPEPDDVVWAPTAGPGAAPGLGALGETPLPGLGGRSLWTPTTAVPTQPGEPVLPQDRDEPAPAAVDAPPPAEATPADVPVTDEPPAAGPALAEPPTDGPVPPAPPSIEPPAAAAPVADRVPEQVAADHPAAPLQDVPARTAPLRPLPTLDDLLATRPRPADGPAEQGWRAVVRRMTGGLLHPGPGPDERVERELVAAVQRPLDGPRTIVVVNPKGGAHKTTATLLLAATFGPLRGGYTLAWDNNETRGTLGWRARHTHHSRTAVDLLEDLARFADPGSSRVGDLDAYVRSQGAAQFDVLASDEDAASAASVDGFAFRALHRTLLRFYRLLIVDTGNNMRASNWQAAIEAADQVVVVSTMREDTAQSAAWALDALRATGHEEAVRRAVTVLSQPAPRVDAALSARLHDHFGRLTRAVLEVPYEPALVSGGPIDLAGLSRDTRRAWLRVAASIADGL